MNARDAVLCFAVYSAAGWVLETLFALAVLKKLVKRGSLIGCICPIYGFGALIAFWSFGLSNALLGPGLAGLAAGALFASLLFSALEYGAGYTLDHVFGKRFWDYRPNRLNIGGYVCLSYSLVWGALGLIFVRYIHPTVFSVIAGIPDPVKSAAAVVFLTFFTLDVLVSAKRALEDSRIQIIGESAREAVLAAAQRLHIPIE